MKLPLIKTSKKSVNLTKFGKHRSIMNRRASSETCVGGDGFGQRSQQSSITSQNFTVGGTVAQ